MRCQCCGSYNPDSDMYCGRCGARLADAAAAHGASNPLDSYSVDSNRPYVVFDHFPWTWMATISMTRSQYMMRVAVGWAIILIFTPLMVYAALATEEACLVVFWLFMIGFIALAQLVSWYAGRDAANRRR